jgi:hypothetical protein
MTIFGFRQLDSVFFNRRRFTPCSEFLVLMHGFEAPFERLLLEFGGFAGNEVNRIA